MKLPRQLAVWGTAALVSLAALGLVMWQQLHEIQGRIAVQVVTRPATGSAVFRNKGCANCHGVSGAGTDIPYPTLSYEETAQLATYLYMSSYADIRGDAKRGERLFRERKCDQCHQREPASGKEGPSLLAISDAEDPLSWTQALWNHAASMQARLEQSGMSWPKFEASDLRDLFAYVRDARNSGEDPPIDVSGDLDRGWTLFQEKRCIDCHAVPSAIGTLGPGFGPDHQLPPTFSEFGAALLNHIPNMESTMKKQKVSFPRLKNHDVADLTVFLYSLHYLEPTGSPQVGKSVFSWRGCHRCHGDNAEGSKLGPALRGRGHVYTAARLASALWAHGDRMYKSAQQHDQPWPMLQVSDISHVITFLNTSPE